MEETDKRSAATGDTPDDDTIPEHLSRWSDSTDLTNPIFLLDDGELLLDEEVDPFKEEDPTLAAISSGTMDWSSDQYTLPEIDPFNEADLINQVRNETRDIENTPCDNLDVANQDKQDEDRGGMQQEEKEEKCKEEQEKSTEQSIPCANDGEGVGEQPSQEEGNELREETEARFRGELMRQSVDMTQLRNLCKKYGVPDTMRGDIWKVRSSLQPSRGKKNAPQNSHTK